MGENATEIDSLPLIQRRRILGYAIPLINGPLLLYNLYTVYIHLQQGMSLISNQFFEDIIVILCTLFLSIAVPRFFPVYKSNYTLRQKNLVLKRLLKPKVEIPYKSIDRAEVFIKETPQISKDAREYATKASTNLKKSGFKFKDYTNHEYIIMNLFSGRNIYMISPAKPKSLLKKLKSRNKKLTAKIVELDDRGKRIRELSK